MNTVVRKKALLSSIVDGYEEIEPAIITALALNANIFFEGKHGIGKSILGRTLGQAMDQSGRGFRSYDAPKAGMIAIGGLPNMGASEKTGELEFIQSKQAIWGAKVILVDELPRADKEKQNYWLEIVEERTFNGKPVNYDMLMATGNTATYKGNFDLDLALKSRFLFWLTAPSFDTVTSDDVIRMIKLNLKGGRPAISEVGEMIATALVEIRQKYQENMDNTDLVDQVSAFIGTFTQFLKDKIQANHELAENGEAYISPREFANHMVHAILGLKAYFDYMGMSESLKLAGQHTIKYVIETRHAAAGLAFVDICTIAWRQLSGLLVGEVDTPRGKIQYKYASAISPQQKVAFWRSHLADAIDALENPELTTMTGDTLQQIRKEAAGLVAPFWHAMKSDPRTEHVANEVFGAMYTDIARKLLAGRNEAGSSFAPLWNKYQGHNGLTSDQVAEILEA